MNSSVDPVTFEVVWHRLLDATEEMGIKYMRTSGSPVLVGAYDASTGITLANGELVAMGPYITTQAHVLRLIVESVLRMRAQSPGIHAGDMFICNDPYLGATHQPDVATVAPVHFGGELRAWVGSSGHWLDIGGPEPGGFNMNAVSVFDEGLRLPPTSIVERGEVREDLVELIMNHIREPLAELDLRGQIVSNESGRGRLLGLFDEFGPVVVESVMREGIDHVERRLRTRLRSLPDGVWREVQFLDHDGHRPYVRKIVCTITKSGDQLRIDFAGSDPQVEGFANCTFGGLRAATLSAVCILLGFDLSWNDGVARCVEIIAPPRSVVSAEYPAPVSLSTISAIIVTLNLVFGAISKMLLTSRDLHEEAMATWCGTSLGVSMMGVNDRGQMTVCPEASHFAAGCGARTYADGVDTGGIIINTTANIPSIEVTEAEYPVLYLFRRQLKDSGGPGRFRGGMSGAVAIIPHDAGGPLETSFAGVGSDVPNAFGLAGGLPGACARYLRFDDADIEHWFESGLPVPLDPMTIPGDPVATSLNNSHAVFPPGMVEYHNWQGGGGFGDPLERLPTSVWNDVHDQAVSQDVAASVYGVVMGTDGPDDGATNRLRQDLRSRRMQGAHPVKDGLVTTVDLPADDETRSGLLQYADLVNFDFDSDTASCSACGQSLGGVHDDFRLGCLVQESAPSVAGPVRGQDYARQAVVLRRYFCPGCSRQLEAEIRQPGDSVHSSFRLVGPPQSADTS